jgi:hypothetical protein
MVLKNVVLRIQDAYPGSEFFPSRIQVQKGSRSRIRIRIKELKYLTQKLFLSSRKYDQEYSSRIRILIFFPSRIQGSKRHLIPDPKHWKKCLDSACLCLFPFSFYSRVGFLKDQAPLLMEVDPQHPGLKLVYTVSYIYFEHLV